MTLAFNTICDNIAGLSVSGVNLKDIDQIPVDCTRLTPCIFPKPDGFVTDFLAVRDSTGGGGSALMTVTYHLNYRLCHSEIGSGRIFDSYDDMLSKAFAFIDAILANDDIAGAVDLTIDDALAFGPVTDPAGNIFHGCDFTLEIMEFVN